ncbi:MAG TPA: hypothetical protein VKS81_09650 [Bacteroidota bacterium]|nr:hypothetical protein [Bacteroidota bacterium]
MKVLGFIVVLILSAGYLQAQHQPHVSSRSGLEYDFDGHYGQVEVGGIYAGAEFHKSRPLPSRISFYYPVANSVDLSTDYWKRGDSQPMCVGIQIGNGQRKLLGKEGWSYTVSPHRVVFYERDGAFQYTAEYDFCLQEAAMVFTFRVANISVQTQDVTVYTHIKPVLRTCQTYAVKDSAITSYDDSLKSIRVDYDDPQTDRATVFVQNVGAAPSSWSSDASALSISDTGNSAWVSSSDALPKTPNSRGKHIPLAAFEYRARLAPNGFVTIGQVIGSCTNIEAGAVMKRLAGSWKNEIEANDEYVAGRAITDSPFITGDSILDRSAVWAKGILVANAHYLDNAIVPMPCPAEYNFFFTHDVLMTDLAAVNFDTGRVKRDLLYINAHSKDSIILHAYYWRDDGNKTEYCTPDNWNHFWFILASAAYLRHSHDTAVVRALLPEIQKSLSEILSQLKSDDLIHAYRPDWWDIGHIDGPRAYNTALAIRSIREFLFTCSYLHEYSPRLEQLEQVSDSMQVALTNRLWDAGTNYLTNYNDGKNDAHYYMGSLLSAAFGMLDSAKARALVATAGEKLLDKSLGVRTAMPPDFSSPEVISYYKFAGEEAGKPYFYIDGGVWPHDNAWYATALDAIGKRDEALKFVKETMTIDGTVHSPHGQPAMYEYRYADPSSPDYGMIDKPSFLWAGGFYLKALYTLFGTHESEWNISFSGPLPRGYENVDYTMTNGNASRVRISGKGEYLESMTIGQDEIPSLVLPIEANRTGNPITLKFGIPKRPYLKEINATVQIAEYDTKGGMDFEVTSFEKHAISATFVSLTKIKACMADDIDIKDMVVLKNPDGLYQSRVSLTGTDAVQHIHVEFEK